MDYLRRHLSMGVFTGVPGADLATVMKLDIAVQLSSVLLNGQTVDSVNGFEAFVKSEASDSSKERVFSELIKWTILNYCGVKSK